MLYTRTCFMTIINYEVKNPWKNLTENSFTLTGAKQKVINSF